MTAQQPGFSMSQYASSTDLFAAMIARITDLEAQLEAIGAGGVSGPLIGQPQAMPDLSQLTERGAKAWAGVDAQGLRDGGAPPSANAGEPSAHIKEPYTLAEIKAKIASNDYSAEMLLQHAMLLLDSASLSANAGQAGEYPALVCDYCGALTPDPWHSSGMLHGKMSKHIHSCDACTSRGQAPALTNLNCKSEQKRLATLWGFVPAQAASVQEDAALWHWLAEYLVGTRTDLDDEIVACETVNDLRKLVEAARKQGASHD